MKNKLAFVITAIIMVLYGACKKKTNTTTDIKPLQKEIIDNTIDKVIVPSYQDMSTYANLLISDIQVFEVTKTEENYLEIKKTWIEFRKAWEITEGFLFGPIRTENIDFRIDAWPINTQSIDSLLAKNDSFPDVLIEHLEGGLKGFHPIEYFVWGIDGKKTFSEITKKELELMKAYAKNLKLLCDQCLHSWQNGHANSMKNPGAQSLYKSYTQIFEEMIGGMAGICTELAQAKMLLPFEEQNPLKEESPFSSNSLADYKDNIQSIKNIYYGQKTADGKGIDEIVKTYNRSLHNKIVQQFDYAVNGLTNISLPYRDAIFAQPIQVQNAINEVDKLGKLLTDELVPLIQRVVQN